MEGGGKWPSKWDRLWGESLIATPKRLMFVEPLKNFKKQIQICIIERQLWSGGERVEGRRLVMRLLVK